MTQAGTRPSGAEGADGDRGRGRAGSRATRAGGPAKPYLEVLRLPGALGFSSAGFVARMPMSMFGLGTVLLIAALTGRYGLAGVVAAGGSVGYAVAAPQFAKLTDRYGQRRVLRPQVTVFAGATVALMVLAEARAPLAAVVVSSVLGGATMPSMGPIVRARWSALLGGTPRLHTAFSLESVADEIIFMVGPVVVTLLATDVYPAAGVAAAMLLCLVGTVLFTAQRRTEPLPRPPAARLPTAGSVPAAGRVPTAASVPTAGSVPGSGLAMGRAARPPRATGLFTLVPVYGLVGAMFAAIELSTVAFAGEHGHKQLAGLVLGVYALGSAAGGLWYGSRHWRAPLPRRFAITLGLMTGGVAMFWWPPGFASLIPVIFVAGVAIAPTLITGYSLIEHLAPPERRTECMTWLSSAIGVGLAVGAPAAGRLIDLSGARSGYLLAAACGAAAFVTCLAGLGRLRAPRAGTGVPDEAPGVGVNPSGNGVRTLPSIMTQEASCGPLPGEAVSAPPATTRVPPPARPRAGAPPRRPSLGGGRPAQDRELRAQGRQTVRKLLEAGLAEFDERGFQAVRVDDIVRRAQTSHGTFYLYFANKEDLFKALLRDALHDMGQLTDAFPVVTRNDAGRAALHKWVGEFCETYAGHAAVIRALSQAENVSEEIWGDGLHLLFRLAEAMTQGMTAATGQAEHAELTALACLMMMERVNYLLSVEVRLPREEMVERISAIMFAAFGPG